MLGQQSLVSFMGLKLDIDSVYQDNMKKAGFRKYGCVLINTGDKLTWRQKDELLLENKEKYGLSPEYLKQLKLPKASNI